MVGEKQGGNGVRELRLEGLGLLLVAGVLIVLLGGAFYVGRWYERQVGPGSAGAPGSARLTDPLANVEAPADIDRSADFFDDVQGAETEAEPQREVPRESPEPVTPPPAAEEAARTRPRPRSRLRNRPRPTRAGPTSFRSLPAGTGSRPKPWSAS